MPRHAGHGPCNPCVPAAQLLPYRRSFHIGSKTRGIDWVGALTVGLNARTHDDTIASFEELLDVGRRRSASREYYCVWQCSFYSADTSQSLFWGAPCRNQGIGAVPFPRPSRRVFDWHVDQGPASALIDIGRNLYLFSADAMAERQGLPCGAMQYAH